jgi:hypothetical protein
MTSPCPSSQIHHPSFSAQHGSSSEDTIPIKCPFRHFDIAGAETQNQLACTTAQHVLTPLCICSLCPKTFRHHPCPRMTFGGVPDFDILNQRLRARISIHTWKCVDTYRCQRTRILGCIRAGPSSRAEWRLPGASANRIRAGG